MGFSPDARYFLAGHDRKHFFYDIAQRHQLPLPGSITNLTTLSFAFLGPDRLVGINPTSPQKSHVLRFPSGEALEEIELWYGLRLRGAAHGNFLFIGPLKDYPLGIIDLTTKERRLVFKQNAADMYDGVFVSERLNGQLALHVKDKPEPLAVLDLPESSLGRLHASAVSHDLNYLAISSRSRGAVWDIAHDTRAFYTRRFNGAGFDTVAMYADFPKFQETPRKLGQLRVDTGVMSGRDLKEEIAIQHGLYLLVTKPRNKNGMTWSDADMEVQDARTGQTLWSRYVPSQLPSNTMNPEDATTLLRWRLSSPGVRDELHRFSNLKDQAGKDDYLCEVMDANSGALIASFLAKTNKGSLRYLRGGASRTWAVMEAVGDQVLAYALPSREEKGHFFGSVPALSNSGFLAVNSERREVAVFDLATSQLRRRYVFSAPVAFKAFSADGQRLLVFTNDQTVYLLDQTLTPAATESAMTSIP